jgi:hypothetical protein
MTQSVRVNEYRRTPPSSAGSIKATPLSWESSPSYSLVSLRPSWSPAVESLQKPQRLRL